MISLGTDTHHAGGLEMMRFGVGIARRAWLEKKDIINCLSYEDIRHRSFRQKPSQSKIMLFNAFSIESNNSQSAGGLERISKG